jgi:hypothetical protein
VTLADFLRDTILRLDVAGIPCMITGSLASSFYGEPRATRDIDVVIDPTRPKLSRLVGGLEADGVYVDRSAAFEALRARTQFNAVSGAEKVDFIVRKERPFSRAEFDRRRRVELLGTRCFVPSVEDLIIAKLEWAAEAGSDLQLRDVTGMLDVGGADVDRAYIERWVSELGLADVWRRVTEVESRPR